MSDVVLDSSAIIAFVKFEQGHEVVAPVIAGAKVSALIVAEVAGWLAGRGVRGETVQSAFNDFGFKVEIFDEPRAMSAGMLITKTRHRGLSLADRACLALAMELQLPVVTADRAWVDLDLGVEITLIR